MVSSSSIYEHCGSQKEKGDAEKSISRNNGHRNSENCKITNAYVQMLNQTHKEWTPKCQETTHIVFKMF